MINIPLNDWWLPIIAFIPLVVSAIKALKQQKFTKDLWLPIILGVLVLFLSINENINSASDKKDSADSLKIFHAKVLAIGDTLRDSRDSLNKIGLRIDERTGQIQVVDSQILKEVLNTKFLIQTNKGLPDSVNFSFKLKNDTLLLFPKEGTWARFYFYADTAYYNENERNSIVNEGMMTPEVEKIKINNRTYVGNLYSVYERAVTYKKPIKLNLNKHPDQFIIFGDQTVLSKRYLYKNKKVMWIPE